MLIRRGGSIFSSAAQRLSDVQIIGAAMIALVVVVFIAGRFVATVAWITGGTFMGMINGGGVTWGGGALVTAGLAAIGLADHMACALLPGPDSGAEEQPANSSSARTTEKKPKGAVQK
jgi:hypothetical protein